MGKSGGPRLEANLDSCIKHCVHDVTPFGDKVDVCCLNTFSLHPLLLLRGNETPSSCEMIRISKSCSQAILPHNLWSSYEYHIHCQSEDSHAHLSGRVGLFDHVDC